MEYKVKHGKFSEAAKWVWDQYQNRERSRAAIPTVSASLQPDQIPDRLDIPRSISSLKMGRSAFSEAMAARKSLGLWAVDYMDGKGPRVRIGPLVAEPTNELPPWLIRLN